MKNNISYIVSCTISYVSETEMVSFCFGADKWLELKSLEWFCYFDNLISHIVFYFSFKSPIYITKLFPNNQKVTIIVIFQTRLNTVMTRISESTSIPVTRYVRNTMSILVFCTQKECTCFIK